MAAELATMRPWTWLEPCYALRDRLLASPRFQRWAIAFPPTRPIARRRARALFDLCAGFVYSQVLQACVELRLLEMLAEGPQTLAALSTRLSLGPEPTARLLHAAASLRLVARRGRDRFGLGQLGAALLGNPAVAAMVEHHRHLYADLAHPVALLRGERRDTALARYWPYAGAERPQDLAADQVAAYSQLMAASQALIAAEVLDAYAFERHRRLLDLGGGDGSFLIAVAARAPALRLMLFDLPPVAERARARLATAGLDGRVHVRGGSFLADSLPQGADLVSLVRVIHDHDDAGALSILRAARRALPQNGVVVVAEPMVQTSGAGAAYFGFYLMAMGRGQARTPDEIAALLRDAGFGPARLLATRIPMLVRVMVAHTE